MGQRGHWGAPSEPGLANREGGQEGTQFAHQAPDAQGQQRGGGLHSSRLQRRRRAAESMPGGRAGLTRAVRAVEEGDGQERGVARAAEGPGPRGQGALMFSNRRAYFENIKGNASMEHIRFSRKARSTPGAPRPAAGWDRPRQVPRAPSCRHQRPASGRRSPCSSA